jgi:hypothetical protein
MEVLMQLNAFPPLILARRALGFTSLLSPRSWNPLGLLVVTLSMSSLALLSPLTSGTGRADEDLPGFEEILRLRKMVGDPFRGTVLESAGDESERSSAEQFAGALRKIVGQDAQSDTDEAESIAAGKAGDVLQPGREHCEEDYQRLLRDADRHLGWGEPAGSRLGPHRGEAGQPATGSAPPGEWPQLGFPGRVQTGRMKAELRRAARQLAVTAEDLEVLERYDEADELRRVADRLRQAARMEAEPP